MVYLKSCLFGLGGAVIAAIVWTAVTFVLPMVVPYLFARLTGRGGMSAANVTSNSILLAALVGFVIAFAWEWQRLRV
jgi:hypothetical protein